MSTNTTASARSTPLFAAPLDFTSPRSDTVSPLTNDKTAFIICIILLGMIVTAAGAWTVHRWRRKGRDLEKMDEESASSGCISETLEKRSIIARTGRIYRHLVFMGFALYTFTMSSRPILNIPSGNSKISEPVQDEPRTGDKVKDFKRAIEIIDLKNDFANIEQIPCIRQTLLTGIAGGAGIGAVRYIASRSPRAGANWAVASFVLVSIFQWNTCNTARRRQLAEMRAIQERVPHISRLKRNE